MIFDSYDKYKESGVSWLGKIPAHWDCVKIKHFTYKVGSGVTPTGGSENYPDEGILFIRSQNVHFDGLKLDDAAFIYEETHNEMSKTAIKYDDVLLNITGASIGRCCVFKEVKTPANVNQHVCILRPTKSLCPDWLSSVLGSKVGQNQIWMSHNGSSREGLNFADLKAFSIPLPPKDEQITIANFLDEKTAHIDGLIEKKRKLLKLLAERRAAIITNAVTKGLNPKAPMKDSGIDWLGQIPEHWKLKKVTHVTTMIGSGTTPKSDNPEYYENGTVNWLVTGDLNDGTVSQTSNKVTDKAIFAHSSLKLYPKGSLLIAMYGATIGKLGILKTETTVNQATCVMSFDDKNSVDFWFNVFLANRNYIISLGYGGGQPNISRDVIKSFRFPCPNSKEEQLEIVEYLLAENDRLDQIEKTVSKIIDKLQEYRSALITEAVTGKIKVA